MNPTVIENFKARSADGEEFDLVVLQHWVDTSSMREGRSKTPGLKSVITSDGLHVNRIDSQTFEVVERQLTVHRVDS
ncbi:MAG: hypothetical protein H7A44_04065 [Opitutaceae bacterium]|nr:hypothetical protein [Opitutaceae bacterium]